jgi:hypothetical protein
LSDLNPLLLDHPSFPKPGRLVRLCSKRPKMSSAPHATCEYAFGGLLNKKQLILFILRLRALINGSFLIFIKIVIYFLFNK